MGGPDRQNKANHMNAHIARQAKLKFLHFLKQNGGKVPCYAWPGGYNIVYYTFDGATLKAKTVQDNIREIVRAFDALDAEWAIQGWDIYWEGPAMQDAHTNEPIESEYGDPDADS